MQYHNPDSWDLDRELERKSRPNRNHGAAPRGQREVFVGGSAGGRGVYRAGGERESHGAAAREAQRRPRAERSGSTREHAVRAQARPPADMAGRTKVRKAVRGPERSAAGGPRKGKPSGKSTAKVVVGNLLKTLLVLVCVGVIALSVVAVRLCAYVTEATADDATLLDLSVYKLPQNGVIQAWDADTGQWVDYQKLVSADANSVWVDLHNIPKILIDAVVSVEDRRYYEHGGVNWGRTMQAALNEVTGSQATFGGSTITQQLVKNITGEDAQEGESGYQRKLKEIFRAKYLDNTFGKDLVMEAYLNTLPLSGTIIGVQAGAEEYFDKDVGELTLPEAALIAGITQAPGKYNPFTNPENAKQRRDQVLWNMWDNGAITEAEYDEAVAQPLGLYDGPRDNAATGAEGNVTSYFTDAVFNEVIEDLMESKYVPSGTREAAVRYYYTAGLTIQCTVDLKLQRKMEEVYAQGNGGEFFPALEVQSEVKHEDGSVTTEAVLPQSAMAVVDYNGALVGVVGGLGEKTESLGLNRATQSKRQVGSTMKPIGAYTLGIDYGVIDYSRMLPDSYVIPEQEWPKNWPGTYAPSGNSVLAYDALAQSLNTCAAHVGQWVGIEPMYEFLEDTLEVSSLVGEGSVSDKGLSPLVLGGMTDGMYPAELAAAYAIFGGAESYGTFNSLHTYERVLDSAGNTILEPEVVTMQAISSESGYIMNRMLKGVLESPVGTARGMGLNTTDSVAKTGTTSDNRDRWLVGLSPNYVAAMWWGYDQNENIEWSVAPGDNPLANAWRAIMDTVQEGTEKTDFPARPEGVLERQFCRDTGLLAGGACGNTQLGYYAADNVPDVCDNHGGDADEDGDGADGDGDDDDG